MTLFSSDFPNMIGEALSVVFQDEYGRPVDTSWMQLCTEINSTKATEKYGFLGANPSMREFKDERQPSGFQENAFTIANKKYESTISINVDAIDDDQYGQIRLQVLRLAETTRSFKEECAYTVLTNGDASTYGLCYDENEFFDTTHKEGTYYTTNQSNLGTDVLSQTSLSAARTKMMAFKDDRGNKLRIVPDTLIVPPELEDTAIQLTKSATVDASGNINVNQGRYKILVTPFFPDTDSWILAKTNGVMKPLIYQNRQDAVFQALEGNSEQGFMRDEWLYGVKTRFAFGYGDWRNAYLSRP
ncbi:MAG: Mu-like prophage major head subunit gpT family protein [Methanobacterium sp.]